jgi:hypothetical protein
MSHIFDLIGMHQQIFRLSHLALGAKEYARLRQLQKGEIDYQSDWSVYYVHIRNSISNDLIELAAKVRVAQDTMLDVLSEKELRELDSDSMGRIPIGKVEAGSFALTLRESCNKIIHAKHFEVGISSARNTRPAYRYNYWNGRCTLRGVQSRMEWSIDLNVHEWCNAMDSFTELMSQYVEW